jgi:uncharacterized membrane protein
MFILIALASPFTFEEEIIEGDYALTILADKSTSFELFDGNIAEKLRDSLKDKLPITIRYIAYGNDSALGDAILNNMQGNDNILLVTDGNNNDGRRLGDIMHLAGLLNTTINSINVKPIKTDLSVTVDAPSEIIFGNDITYYIDVKNINEPLSYDVELSIDNEVVYKDSGIGTKTFTFTPEKWLLEGYHKIIAEIKVNDYFKENNVFYKTIRVYPKPNILYIAKESGRLERILERVYNYNMRLSIPLDLSPYPAIILDDISASEINKRINDLSEYVSKGNGLVVIGGKSSYDYGDYQNSLAETLLPVKVGVAERKEEETDVNVVLVIDISGSSTLGFSQGSATTKISIQKAQAIEILKYLRPEDKVGVVAFDTHGYYITKKLLPLYEQPNLNKTIAMIKSDPSAGTFVHQGLIKAFYLLENAKGAKNIILISDGITQYPDQAIQDAILFNARGIKIFTVGIGKDTNSKFMTQLAEKGNGQYYEPSEKEKIVVLLNQSTKKPSDFNNLIILDGHHFITNELSLRSSITGFNQVIPKPASRILISTINANPILTIWQFGKGRVASLTTNPEYWAGDLLNKDNSELITRIINWAIEDPDKTKEFIVKTKDTYLGRSGEILVKTKQDFSSDELLFSKIRRDLYKATFTPATTGFYEYLNAVIAVNNPKEYHNIGLNPELAEIVSLTGGKTFEINETDALIDFIKEKSKRKKIQITYYRWPFIAIALFLLLIEISIRRLRENRNIFK